MNKSIFVIITALVLFTSNLFSQISSKTYPMSFKYHLNNKVPLIELENINNEELILEDAINEKNGITPLRFAKTIYVSDNIKEKGVLSLLDNGDKVWQIAYYSQNAISLNIIFSKFLIPDGAMMHLYNESRTKLLGTYTNVNQIETGKLATSIIYDNKIIIEYYEPKIVIFSGIVEVYKVNHGYRTISSVLKDILSGSCNVNINCPTGSDWQTQKRAICKIIMGGTNLCSGALINNTLQDGTPYFLTANHCTGQPYDEWVFYFNYESASCTGTTGTENQTISGCQLIATTTKLDFCLVKLNIKPPQSYNPYYAGWNISTTPATSTTCIHHPSGDIKKISKDNNPPSISNYGSGYDYNSHWLIGNWEVGTTEGGSSGSPLFDSNKKIIGNLTGGQANCANSVNDYFSRIDLAWNKYTPNNQQLKIWLDPNNSGVTSINGYDPYSSPIPTVCDTITNVANGELLTAYNFTSEWGYWSGHNEFIFKKFADQYISNSSKFINSVEFPIFKAYYSNSSAYITIKIWNNLNNKPNQELYSQNININQFTPINWEKISLNNQVEVVDTFYVGYEIYYNNPVDTFAVYQVQSRGVSGLSSAYVYYNNNWNKYNEISSLYTSFGTNVYYCNTNSFEEKKLNINFKIYPNPVNDFLKIETDLTKIRKISISNLIGQKIYSDIDFCNDINVSKLKSGIYLLNIETVENLFSRRFIITR